MPASPVVSVQHADAFILQAYTHELLPQWELAGRLTANIEQRGNVSPGAGGLLEARPWGTLDRPDSQEEVACGRRHAAHTAEGTERAEVLEIVACQHPRGPLPDGG
jgi:hypothetical protein